MTQNTTSGIGHSARVAAGGLALAASLGLTAPAAAQHTPVRLRLGAGTTGGGFVGAFGGAGGGVVIRAGVQLDDLVGVYVQGHGLLGSFLPAPNQPVALGAVFHELVVDFTFADLVQVGAGPSIDVLFGCTADVGAAVCDRPGPYFGGDLRLALTIDGAHRRAGTAITFDVHPTWLGADGIVTFLVGLGGEVD